MLEAGDAAPDFTLPDQDGRELTLSRLQGRPVVLYFYPRAEALDVSMAARAKRWEQRVLKVERRS